MAEERRAPVLLEFLFGEAAGAAERGASERLRRWFRAFEDWLGERLTLYSKSTHKQSVLVWKRLLRERRKMPWELGAGDLEEHARWMQAQGYAASTIANMVGIVANFYRWCDERGVDPECGAGFNPAAGVRRPKVGRYVGADGKPARLLSREEVGALLGILKQDHSPLGRREYAFFLARLRLGVPLKALQQLEWGQVSLVVEGLGGIESESEGEAALRFAAWVRWRTEAERQSLPGEVWEAIRAYLEASGRLAGMRAGKYVFAPLAEPGKEGTGRAAQDWREGQYLSSSQLLANLKTYGRAAGIGEEKLTLQALRRTAMRLRLDAADSGAEDGGAAESGGAGGGVGESGGARGGSRDSGAAHGGAEDGAGAGSGAADSGTAHGGAEDGAGASSGAGESGGAGGGSRDSGAAHGGAEDGAGASSGAGESGGARGAGDGAGAGGGAADSGGARGGAADSGTADSVSEVQAFLDSQEEAKSVRYRLSKLPKLPEGEGRLTEEAELAKRVPERQAKPFKPGDGLRHGMYAQSQPPEAVRAILAENIQGVEEEIAGLRALGRGLLERRERAASREEAADLVNAYTQGAARLAELIKAEEELGKRGPEDRYEREFKARVEEMLRNLDCSEEAGGDGERAAGKQAAGGGRLAEEIAGLRYVLRNTFEMAMETVETGEYVRLVGIYGSGCVRLVRMLRLEASHRGRFMDEVQAAIEQALEEVMRELGIG